MSRCLLIPNRWKSATSLQPLQCKLAGMLTANIDVVRRPISACVLQFSTEIQVRQIPKPCARMEKFPDLADAAGPTQRGCANGSGRAVAVSKQLAAIDGERPATHGHGFRLAAAVRRPARIPPQIPSVSQVAVALRSRRVVDWPDIKHDAVDAGLAIQTISPERSWVCVHLPPPFFM